MKLGALRMAFLAATSLILLSFPCLAAEYISPAFPPAAFLKGLYVHTTGYCTPDQVIYGGKVKTTVNASTVYNAYLQCPGHVMVTFQLTKTDLGYWNYEAHSVLNGWFGSGLLQTSY